MKKLIEKIFDKDDISIFGKDRIKIVDENSRKLNVEYLRAKSIENIFVEDNRSDLVYNIEGKFYYRMFDLKEYLKL